MLDLFYFYFLKIGNMIFSRIFIIVNIYYDKIILWFLKDDGNLYIIFKIF